MSPPPSTAKRDRWASSSEDEEDRRQLQKKHKKEKKHKKDKKKSKRDTAKNDSSTLSTSTAAAAASASPQLPLHNPLLQGCRSVYETYERLERVSEGTYGVVWKARDLATNEITALKQIKFFAQTDQSYLSTTASVWKEGFPMTALREISVLMALQHESIVSVKEMVVGDGMDKVFMVMEFFECDLKDALARQATGNPLAQSELKGILQQILAGTEHMHSKWYLHRDLKPSNILVKLSPADGTGSGGRIALADFGLARRYQDPAVCMTLPVVTLWYRAPELLFGEQHYGPGVDMWSIGCIMGELIKSGGSMKSSEHDEESEDDDSNAIMKGQGEIDQIDQIFSMLGVPTGETWPSFDKLPNAKFLRWKPVKNARLPLEFPVAASTSSRQTFLDANGYHLLLSLLCLDPSQRITAEAARNHAYFHQGVAPRTPEFFTTLTK